MKRRGLVLVFVTGGMLATWAGCQLAAPQSATRTDGNANPGACTQCAERLNACVDEGYIDASVLSSRCDAGKCPPPPTCDASTCPPPPPPEGVWCPAGWVYDSRQVGRGGDDRNNGRLLGNGRPNANGASCKFRVPLQGKPAIYLGTAKRNDNPAERGLEEHTCTAWQEKVDPKYYRQKFEANFNGKIEFHVGTDEILCKEKHVEPLTVERCCPVPAPPP